MNPRQYKATISLNKAINKFLEEGYYVFTNVCEQGPIDIVVVNPANGRARYFDVKTSRGTRIVNGKAVGGSGNKLKPQQKELRVRLVVVEGDEVRIIETRETVRQRQRKEKKILLQSEERNRLSGRMLDQ